ncbi:hypothetical protein MJO29_000435 [Puccinia striiformis f. sp. tritici]|nr:hypothetical protein MJO29_000435 [Puccinia striiformis f. sp. tritici]
MNPIAMFEATSATTPQPVPQAIPNATQAIVLNNLMKSTTNIHREGNARKVVLDNHGTNYKQWEVSIDHTLMHAFCVDKIFVNNKGCWSSLASQQAASIRGRSKIELATTLLNLANDASPSDEFTIAKWSKDLSALTKLKVTTNELVGLMLQNAICPPAGTNLKTFEFSVNHSLNKKEDIKFDNVTKVIDAATSKLKPKPGTSDYSPMDLDKIQAFNQRNLARYVPPHLRNLAERQKADQVRLNQDKAAHHRGKGQSKSLLAKYGKNCAHCEEEGHCYISIWAHLLDNT